MNGIARSACVGVFFVFGLSPASAQTQQARTFVSSFGNDANDCGRFTPCRTFQRAHDQTLSLGEITVLDPGGYGAVTITKGISIINDGVGEAGALISGGFTGITISAPATEAVSLRGLTVKGIGFGGGNGIVFNSGKSLAIENCAIRNLDGNGVGNGIVFIPNGGTSKLAVSNTVIAENSTAGMIVRPTGSVAVKVALNRVEIYNNAGFGIFLLGNNATGLIDVTAVDSVVANNDDSGFRADSNSAETRVMVSRSAVINNSTGLDPRAPQVTMRVGQTQLTGNGIGWNLMLGATVLSYGDNSIDGNITDGGLAPLINKR